MLQSLIEGLRGAIVVGCVAVCCCMLQNFAVCCSVLQCVAVFCSVLQCVADFSENMYLRVAWLPLMLEKQHIGTHS